VPTCWTTLYSYINIISSSVI